MGQIRKRGGVWWISNVANALKQGQVMSGWTEEGGALWTS
jgi:hypothetical protein